MPNRFGIKPGHRWDGVDRSNGYEKRWFEAQNAKVARQEEAYKWSTSDMWNVHISILFFKYHIIKLKIEEYKMN